MEYQTESEGCRLSYLNCISDEFLYVDNYLLPSASQQRFYDDALGHLAHLFSNQEDRNSCCKKEGRKFCLKKILNLLQRMERKRLYDPPADHEMKYYLLIKKYIRSIMTFFSARRFIDHEHIETKYKCFSDFDALHHVEELAELNGSLAELSEFVSTMDIRNGSAIKPLMGIRDNYEMASVINGSKERSNRFYRHKFMLAHYDVASSVSAYFPPTAQEKKSYSQVLEEFPYKDKGAGAVNVYSEDLYQVYLVKMGREVSDLEGHCRGIKKSILNKLPMLNECWESLAKDYSTCGESDDESSLKLRYKLAEKCSVSMEELPEYIASVERCRDIAFSLFMFISGRELYDIYLPKDPLEGEKRRFGWESLHIVTLLKTGCFSRGNVFQESILLRNSEEDVSDKKRKRVDDQEEKDGGNVKILKAIISDLRHIGDSDMKIDMEENDLIYKIWMRVASSVHFFVSAMAYEQQRYVVLHGGLPNGGKIGVRTSTRKRMAKDRIDETKLLNMIYDLKLEMEQLSKVLNQYNRALQEKLGALELRLSLSLSL